MAAGFLLVFVAAFLSLYDRLGDGVFIICNVLPLLYAALFGVRKGLAYATAHVGSAFALGGLFRLNPAGFFPNGLLATIVMLIMTVGIGRIRELSRRLAHELAERRGAELELQQYRLQLESLVEERTNDLVSSNQELKREMAERERAEKEKQELEQTLKRAEKMEAIGLLAGGVAHDLNNILSSVIAYPELLLMELPETSPMRGTLVAIHESGKRAAAVVDDLLSMARQGMTAREVLDLNQLLRELQASAEFQQLASRHRDVQVETVLDAELLCVSGSASHLTRAVLNVVLNGFEAMPSGGRIVISTTNVYVDAPSDRYERLPEGEFVSLCVEDTGVGIAAENLDRIFEPFYTKKAIGRSGTGLGMAIVWGTVKEHDGYVDVQSEPGLGTRVTLFLPASRSQPRQAAPRVTLDEHRGHGESILVVDDVAAQRQLCTAILRQLGYSAVAVAGGEAAVEHVRQNAVDLVILDMIMDPGIDGLETYRRIAEARPGQRALIVSGFSETERVKRAQALGAGAYVRKPYTLETLALAVRDAIRATAAARGERRL